MNLFIFVFEWLEGQFDKLPLWRVWWERLSFLYYRHFCARSALKNIVPISGKHRSCIFFSDSFSHVDVDFAFRYGGPFSSLSCPAQFLEAINKGSEYFVFSQNVDVTATTVSHFVAEADSSGADFVYSDSIDSVGGPVFKPCYSPLYLKSCHYIGSVFLVRSKVVQKLGSSVLSNCDYDELQRACIIGSELIARIPRPLYKEPVVGYHTPSVTAREEKVNEPTEPPLISIIIPFKDKPDLLRQCVESIVNKSTYTNFEIIAVSGNSTQTETFEEMKRLEHRDKRISCIEFNEPFNYSRVNNMAVMQHSRGEYIVLLNNDTEVISENWLEEMLLHAQKDDVGAVGAKLYYSNDTIQHAGVVIGMGGTASHVYSHYPKSHRGYLECLVVSREVSAVTAACLMIQKRKYLDLGGLNEENLVLTFNDVDFCLRLREKGYRNIYTPKAELYHYESLSRGRSDSREKKRASKAEATYIHKRHSHYFICGDPYFSKHFSLRPKAVRIR